MAFAEPRVRSTRVQARVGGRSGSEHQRTVSGQPDASVAGGARGSVDDHRPVVLGPDDVRDGRVGFGRAVDAAGHRAGQVDVTGLGEHVRQICSGRSRRQQAQQQQRITTARRHRCLRHPSSAPSPRVAPAAAHINERTTFRTTDAHVGRIELGGCTTISARAYAASTYNDVIDWWNVTAAGGRRGLCTDVTASATKHARSRRTQLRQSRAPTPTRVIRRQ